MKRWLVVGGIWCILFGATHAGAQEGAADDGAEDADVPVERADAAVEDAGDEDEGDGLWFSPFGYVRLGFDWVGEDPNFDVIGSNNGFVLHNARIGLEGGYDEWHVSFRISVDGAEDLRENVNSPRGSLDVRLRDAYVREDFIEQFGVQAGQFKLPFSAEELRSTGSLLFVSRPVGLNGVRVGRGLEQPGIVVGRDLGLMVSPQAPIFFGGSDFGLAYYLAVANGNGPNEILNDNRSLALVGRLELVYGDWVTAGFSVIMNDRTEGDAPDLFEEEDFGISGDLMVTWEGLEVSGQFTKVTSSFPTSGTDDRDQVAWHAQVSYVVDQLPVPFAPGYRFATFHPRAEGGTTAGGVNLDSYELTYHTIGLRAWVPDTPLMVNVNYTMTGEEAPRELENDLVEALIQVTF